MHRSRRIHTLSAVGHSESFPRRCKTYSPEQRPRVRDAFSIGSEHPDDALAPSSQHDSEHAVSDTAPVDIEILYCTLVADEKQPDGFFQAFKTQEKTIIPASERVDKRTVKMSNQEAALRLHQQQESQQQAALHTKTAEDQFLLAVAVTTRRYRVSFQQKYAPVQNARKDAGASERDKWTTVLATMIRHTPCSPPL